MVRIHPPPPEYKQKRPAPAGRFCLYSARSEPAKVVRAEGNVALFATVIHPSLIYLKTKRPFPSQAYRAFLFVFGEIRTSEGGSSRRQRCALRNGHPPQSHLSKDKTPVPFTSLRGVFVCKSDRRAELDSLDRKAKPSSLDRIASNAR